MERKGLLSYGTLSSYEPTLREKTQNWLSRNWYGDTREGMDKAEFATKVLDYTPAGLAFGAYDASRAGASGDYVTAGLLGAAAFMPGGGAKRKVAQEAEGAVAKGLRAYQKTPKPIPNPIAGLPDNWHDARPYTINIAKEAFPGISDAQARHIKQEFLSYEDAVKNWQKANVSGEKKFARDFVKENAELIGKVHKVKDLDFTAVPIDVYKNTPAITIHKSPSHNGRQSSEYKIGLVEGRPAYFRKSNHWGTFGTNITDVDEAVKAGIPHDEALRLKNEDQFGRIGKKYHNWNILGGDASKATSQAGYVPLDDKMMEILKKYGWVPGAAIPTAALLEHQLATATQPES